VARDRQKAKRRKEKRQPKPPSRQDGGEAQPSPPARGDGEGIVPEPRSIHRENVPGPVEHTGDVDEFEAELVAGADGEEVSEEEFADEEAERLALESDAEEALGREAAAAPQPPAVRGSIAPTQDAHGRGGRRFANFLRASAAELQRVQWPDRRQVGQATAVVLGFVIIAGAFLGVADFVAEKLVDLII
jgi:preprotein translocase SecE subunit